MPDDLERIARTVIDCGFHLHRDLGPGMLESVYEVLLAHALREAGLFAERQVPVELKSSERLMPVHAKQVLTYLRLMKLPLGLLMNFGQATFKDGIQRISNDYYGNWR